MFRDVNADRLLRGQVSSCGGDEVTRRNCAVIEQLVRHRMSRHRDLANIYAALTIGALDKPSMLEYFQTSSCMYWSLLE
jgi:hypothetical protein